MASASGGGLLRAAGGVPPCGAARRGRSSASGVLVTGCGPIGALCVLAARAAGAAEIVATDIAPATLAVVKGLGVATTLNTAEDPDALKAYEADKGTFDVLFEASGNMKALTGAFAALRPGAVIVQVGHGRDFTIPISVLVAKEFELRGTFRFHEEFAMAVQMIGERRIDVRPLLTATLPMAQAVEAFHLPTGRRR